MTAHPETRPRRGPVPIILFVVVGLLILLFLSWYQGWWGRPLSDEQIVEYLDPSAPAGRIQHALAQLEDRLGPRYAGRERFRDPVAALKAHPEWEVRSQAAQVMGREPAEAYQSALRELVADPHPVVARNAACALSNFRDPLARPVLLEALKPVTVVAPAAGRLDLKLKAGDAVSSGRALGRIRDAAGVETEVRAWFGGYAEDLPAGRDGDVKQGDPIVIISPDPKSVLAAIVALRSAGTKEDADALEPYAEGRVARMTPEIAPEARRTLEQLRKP